jgi:outer membrane protein TolC
MRERAITASGDLAVARLALADAAGLPLDAPVVIAAPAVPATPADGDALVAQALGSHPDLRGAALHVRLADNELRTARAAWLPTVGVRTAWELDGATPRDQQGSWIVGAEVRVNVFRGFADAARLAEARQRQLRAAADQERVARRIALDVRAAVARLTAARARDDAGRAALAQAREAQRIIRDRYDNGLATMTDVLRAAEAALDAESRAMAAASDVILQGVALDRAVGRL